MCWYKKVKFRVCPFISPKLPAFCVVEIYDLPQLFLQHVQLPGFNLYYLEAFIHSLKQQQNPTRFIEALVYARLLGFKNDLALVKIHLKYYLQATRTNTDGN